MCSGPALTLRKNVTIHQVTTILATSKTVLFPGHNHLLTTGTYDPSLCWCSGNNQRVKSQKPVNYSYSDKMINAFTV